MISIADCITAVPKFRSDTGVSAVAQQTPHFTVLNLVTNFSPKLEVVPPVINRPRAVRFHVNAILGVFHQVENAAGELEGKGPG